MDEVLPPPSKPPSIPPTANADTNQHNTRWRDVLVDYGNLMWLAVGLVSLLTSVTFFGGKALYTLSVETAVIAERVKHLEQLAEENKKHNEKTDEKLDKIIEKITVYKWRDTEPRSE